MILREGQNHRLVTFYGVVGRFLAFAKLDSSGNASFFDGLVMAGTGLLLSFGDKRIGWLTFFSSFCSSGSGAAA